MELQGSPGRGHRVTVPVRVDPRGLAGPTKKQAAGSQWRRTSRGFYVPADTEPTALQRVVEAGILLPSHAAVTGWAALCWLGGWWFSGLESDGVTPLPVPIASSRHRMRPQPLVSICEERWDPKDVVVVDGLPITTAVRSVWFEMRYAQSVENAVVVLDLAAFHDLASIYEVWAYAHRHPSYTGIGQCRDAVWLADENAWSPMEVSMRQSWVAAGHPRPLTNRPVFDHHGVHLGTPDLIDPDAGVIGEYDGAVHRSANRHAMDIERVDRFRKHGLEEVVMTSGDRHDRWAFTQRLHGAYARARDVPVSRRRWTLDPPAWWRQTFTVDQRRALNAEESTVWLRHRAA